MNVEKKLLFFPIFLILYEFCTNMSNDMYLPALPEIVSSLSTNMNWVQLTIPAWLAGNVAVQLFLGPLADRFGRRRVLLTGGVIFILSTLGCAIAPTIGTLILFRFFQGIGVCSMMVAGYASVHDLYSDEKAIHILVWMGSAAVIAPAIGPVLGGLLLLMTSWRGIFWTLFLLSSISIFFLMRCMPESLSVEEQEPLHPRRIVSVYRNIFTNRAFLFSALSFGFFYGGIIGWITVSPFLLMMNAHLSPTQFGLWQVPIFGSYIVGAQAVKFALKRFGMEKLISWGSCLAILSIVALVTFPFMAPREVCSYTLPMIGYALGFGFAAAPLNRLTLTSSSEKRGSCMAVFYLMMIGSGMLVSLVLSFLDENVFLSTFIIASSVLLSFFFNHQRKAV